MGIEYWKANYLDASAAVKLVVDEDGSAAMRPYFGRTEIFYMTQPCVFETLGTLKAKYKYRKSISREHYYKAAYLFLAELGNKIQLEEVQLWSNFFKARELGKNYDLDLSDAFQLLSLKEGRFSTAAEESKSLLITADGPLAKAAAAEGLRVWNILESSLPPEA